MTAAMLDVTVVARRARHVDGDRPDPLVLVPGAARKTGLTARTWGTGSGLFRVTLPA